MDELVTTIGTLITRHHYLAGPLIGLLSFCESLAVVGLLIPGTAIMITVGGLIGAGVLDPLPILAGAIIGAVLGDWVSFLLGRTIGPAVYRTRALRRHKPMVARARLFFHRFGFFAVFLGRFLGPVRATIPLVAGVMRMESRPFQWANILSALLWVPAVLAPGYLSARKIGGLDQLGAAHLIGFAILMLVFTLGAGFAGMWILGGTSGQRKARRERLIVRRDT
jgi:membrane protein DedA with SNARE-associated domain